MASRANYKEFRNILFGHDRKEEESNQTPAALHPDRSPPPTKTSRVTYKTLNEILLNRKHEAKEQSQTLAALRLDQRPSPDGSRRINPFERDIAVYVDSEDQAGRGFSVRISGSAVRLVADTLLQSNITHSDRISAEGDSSDEGTTYIDYIRLISMRTGLESQLEDSNSSGSPDPYIMALLELCVAPPEIDTNKEVSQSENGTSVYFPGDPDNYFAAVHAQEAIISRGKVSFADLPKLFLPGELVCTQDPTPLQGSPYEQCWKVESYRLTDDNQVFALDGLGWLWTRSIRRFLLKPSRVLDIKRYEGERDITFQDLGIMPFKSLDTVAKIRFRERASLLKRSLLDLTRNGAPDSICEYDGPIDINFAFHSRCKRNESMALSGGFTRYDYWDKLFTGRVVFWNLDLLGWLSEPSSKDVLLDTLSPITDETSMILQGHTFVETLPSLEGVWVDVSLLKPVTWDATSPSRDPLQASQQILNGVQSFVRPGDSRSLQLRHRAGATFTIRSQSLDGVAVLQVLEDVAERLMRPLIVIDSLDLLGDRPADGDEDEDGQMLSKLQDRLELVMRVSAVVCLQNFAPLLRPRSLDRRSECRLTTKFIQILASYPGVVFICLKHEDEVDSKFKKMQPIEVQLDEE